jgi:hypothetical protein
MKTGTLAELAAYINDLNLKGCVLIAYDSDADTWVIVEADSTTGKLKVDTT